MLRRSFLCLVLLGGAWAQTPDLTKQPTVYVVGYAHLDTQWRWEYPTTISEYIRNTMRDNFALFEKYPHYVFNFSGANRYRMMKEYFPADYERVKHYVTTGQWFPAGSAMEESDVNSPNAESIIRQILYGKQYFRREFGKTSAEYMLPDCFGFPASLPSILAHTGIKGFSTQKLSSSWQPAPRVGGPDSPEKTPDGIPFNVGLWEGTDGKMVIAALNPGSYSGGVNYDISKTPPPPPPPPTLTPEQEAALTPQQRQMRQQYMSRARGLEDWVRRTKINGELTGIFADYHYYGTGDVGGAPNEASVKLMEAIVTKASIPQPNPFAMGGRGGRGNPDQAQAAAPPPPEVVVGDGPVKILSTNAEQMFLDIKPEQTSKFPKYKGDLELINHSAGSITSETIMKRWNRKNEVLADAAEKASIAAALLGARPYPIERLNDAWTLIMGGQFHDIIPGTATPTSYEYAWNDQLVAANQFASVLTSASEAVAIGLNTQTKGVPVVVYNSLNIPREDVVEAKVSLPAGTTSVRVTGPDGKEVPAQWQNGKVLFLAKAPSVGYAVFDVQAAAGPVKSALKVTESSLENARYAVKLSAAGDITSIFDKTAKKEILANPIRLVILTDNPRNWPAWNMDFDQEQAPPRTIIGGPAKIRIVENGPVRIAVEVSRQAEDSTFIQTVRLSAGDAGDRVEIANAIDWKAKEANLKATFSLNAANPNATYNWDIGTVERPNENERQFEVASHQWIDLTDKSGAYGVTILTDCKNASDKPGDSSLRLTLLRTPGARGGYPDQATQDWGHHEFVYGLAGHAGDYRAAQTDWQAYRLNQPLMAFESPKHASGLGKSFSLLNVNGRIRVMAVKKAEQSDEVIVRMVEMDGKPASSVQVGLAAPIVSAREVNGAEEPVGPASVVGGKLSTSFTAFQPRTFALKLGPLATKVAPVQSQPVKLAYDLAVASNDDTKSVGGFDAKGQALPAEMLPSTLSFNGVQFQLGPAKTGTPNALVAKGQTIALPAGKFNRVYVLAASSDGDQKATFRAGAQSFDLTIQDWGGFIGQWDTRLWEATDTPMPSRNGGPARTRHDPFGKMTGLRPGFVKSAAVAWFASHHHTADGANVPYAFSYLFAYPIDVPAGAQSITLPDNDKIRVLAISTADEPHPLVAAAPLFDTLQ